MDEDRNREITNANVNYNGNIECPDSSNGGLTYVDNKEVADYSKDDICKKINIPNIDLNLMDCQTMVKKPKMAISKNI